MKDYNKGILQQGESVIDNNFGNYIRNIGTGKIKVVATNTKKTVKAFSTVISGGGWRSPESEYNHWVITNVSGVALPVSVLIGKGEAGESEVQISADVNALTRFDNLTKDGDRYIGGYLNQAAVDVYSHVCLWNKSGSGVDLQVNSLRVNSVSGAFSLRHHNSNVGFLDWTALVVMKHNKDISLDNGAATINSYGGAALLGTQIAYAPADLSGAVTAFDFKNAPFKVPPGNALIVSPTQQNSGITAIFEWSEENV